MKNLQKFLLITLISGFSGTCLLAENQNVNVSAVVDAAIDAINQNNSSNVNKKTNREIYDDGAKAIVAIAEDRNFYKNKAQALEKAKTELERLLAGVQIEGGEVGELVKKITLLKKELDSLFIQESTAAGTVPDTSIDSIIKKIAILKKELTELFPEKDGKKNDIVNMVQQLTELKQTLKEMFPATPVQAPVATGTTTAVVSTGSIAEAVEKLEALKQELFATFPAMSDKPEDQDLQVRIRRSIEKYISELSNKENALKKLNEEARKLKKDLKEVTDYFSDIVEYAKKCK